MVSRNTQSPLRIFLNMEFTNINRFHYMEKDMRGDQILTIDLSIWFRLERVNSNFSLERKMKSLFQSVRFKECSVLRRAGDTFYRATLDKENLILLLDSENLGFFGDDYAITVNGFHINKEEQDKGHDTPETPLKNVEPNQNTDDNILKIEIKKGEEWNSPIARGIHTYNLLSDFTEIENILVHFNINMNAIKGLIKPTPAIPNLLVVLDSKLSDFLKKVDITREPFLMYQPSPQSENMGRSQLWAHAILENDQFDRRVMVEGIYKRVSSRELVHTLSYSGDVLNSPQPLMWKGSDLPNGDVVLNMRLHTELNFVMIKGEAYKVSYSKQERQCGHCWSWQHVNFECDKWDRDGRTMMVDYHMKWKRLVNFKEYQPLKENLAEEEQTPVTPKNPDQPPAKGDSSGDGSQATDKDDIDPAKLLNEYNLKYNHKAQTFLGRTQRALFQDNEDVEAMGKAQSKGHEGDAAIRAAQSSEEGGGGATQGEGRGGTAQKEAEVEGGEGGVGVNQGREPREDGGVSQREELGEGEGGGVNQGEAAIGRALPSGECGGGTTQGEAGMGGGEGEVGVNQGGDLGEGEGVNQGGTAKSSLEGGGEATQDEGGGGTEQQEAAMGGGEEGVGMNQGKETGDGEGIKDSVEKNVSLESKEAEEAEVKNKEETTEDTKKRKYGSATKQTPDKKKLHVNSNDNRELFKELKKMEKDISKKDLSEVKKRILKSRLEEYLVTNNEDIKRLQEEERFNLKRIETSIRASLEKGK